MKINQYISKGLFALGCLSFAACSSEDESATSNVSPVLSNGKMQVTASMSDDNVTRTSYNNNNVSWSGSDAIWIYNSNKHNNVVQYGSFTIETLKNEKEAIFTGNAISYKEKATDGENQMYALYPAPTNGGASTIVTSNGTTTLSTELPAVQTAVDNSFDPKAHIMTAHSTNTTFYFNNLVTLVKVTVGDTGPFNVHAVRLTANKPLAGQFTATINADGTTQNVTVSAGSNSVVIEKNNNGTFTKLKGDYYIAVLPGSLSEGFTIQFEDLTSGDEKIYQRKVKAGTSSDAGKVIKIGTYSTATDGYKIGDVNTGLPVSATGGTAFFTGGIIDLGLPSGTLWATRNLNDTHGDNVFAAVGEYGGYYSWGEVFAKGEIPTNEGIYADVPSVDYTLGEYLSDPNNVITDRPAQGWTPAQTHNANYLNEAKVNYSWKTYKYGYLYEYNRTFLVFTSYDLIYEMEKDNQSWLGWIWRNKYSAYLDKYNTEDDLQSLQRRGSGLNPERPVYGTKKASADNLIVLDDVDDAAYLKTNGKFIMPTKNDAVELSENVSHIKSKLTSKVPGYTTRSITMPLAGSYYWSDNKTQLKEDGSRARYWTKSLAVEENQIVSIAAASIDFNQSATSISINDDDRYAGKTIRPILNAKKFVYSK